VVGQLPEVVAATFLQVSAQPVRIEGLTAIEDIYLSSCGVTSLHALAGLVAPGLKGIYITGSSGLEEEHLGLPPDIAAFVSIL